MDLEVKMEDYKTRSYLSAVEAAKFLGIPVQHLHGLVKKHKLKAERAASGQYRFKLNELQKFENNILLENNRSSIDVDEINLIEVNDTIQKVFVKNAQTFDELDDNSIHLMLTSPPYFNAKMYSRKPIESDLGNIHDLDEWFREIRRVWSDVYRVLQPGRKAFINSMVNDPGGQW